MYATGKRGPAIHGGIEMADGESNVIEVGVAGLEFEGLRYPPERTGERSALKECVRMWWLACSPLGSNSSCSSDGEWGWRCGGIGFCFVGDGRWEWEWEWE